ncbi:hypothetical protein [Apibacter adventoris]|uniref:hypothetical protein n=1 Tax=Apibacter adventoris TaxID=1679466 RepID=UPI000D43F004|nr:hypothetical protein [Apibacter adventoris]PQL95218.1 hypothetical protein C4S76_03255 [Apibacter adventoris]
MKMNKFTIEQYVIINEILGCIIYVSENVIGLSTDKKEIICINVKDIKKVKFLEETQLFDDYIVEYEGYLYIYFKNEII